MTEKLLVSKRGSKGSERVSRGRFFMLYDAMCSLRQVIAGSVYATWFLLTYFYLFFLSLFACNFCKRLDHRCGYKIHADFSTSLAPRKK